MGWQIIFVDAGKRLRNGGITRLSSAEDAEQEAWDRAAIHDSVVRDRNDKVLNVVCAKIR
jgi:hypothetical protein|tara:strand:+ start:867 stop:1046 length:180 start_codon:yes stop_codon:yes gene_type:complete